MKICKKHRPYWLESFPCGEIVITDMSGKKVTIHVDQVDIFKECLDILKADLYEEMEASK